MSDPKLVIASVSDEKFVAASTEAPYFCTVGDSADAVRSRAVKAAEFYQGAVSRSAPVAPRIIPQIVQVVPYETETWPPEPAMSVA